MKDFRNATPSEILDYIVNGCISQDVAKKCTYVILGAPGTTGKTWLTNHLKARGYKAIEITEDVISHVAYCDSYNHVIEDPFSTRMTIILNKPYHEPIPKPKTDVDIHKLIDDAMAKKDRTVSIFIGPLGTSVDVLPITDEKPRWIETKPITNLTRHRYRCSECGALNDYPAPYCPLCGEKLTAPKIEEVTDENEA